MFLAYCNERKLQKHTKNVKKRVDPNYFELNLSLNKFRNVFTTQNLI